MKLLKLIIIYFLLSIFLNSCGTLGEAGKVLRNEKMGTTDEFLVKKKEPLTQPPNFEKIPEPGSIKNNEESGQNSFEKILKTSQPQSNSKNTKSSSTEESILKQIKK